MSRKGTTHESRLTGSPARSIAPTLYLLIASVFTGLVRNGNGLINCSMYVYIGTEIKAEAYVGGLYDPQFLRIGL